MRAGTVSPGSLLAASAVMLLSACAAASMPEFGDLGACRTVYVFSGGLVQPVNSCGGVPRDQLLKGSEMPTGSGDLTSLLAAPKFEPDAYYAGVDLPEDKVPLTTIVQDALRDLIAMSEPRDTVRVRQRLARAIEAVDEFATEDREQAYVYLVLAWREAGFTSESGLFAVPDASILRPG